MIIDTLVSFFLQETLYAFAGKRLHVGGCVFVRLLWKSSLNEEWLEWCPNFTSFTVLSEFLYGCVCVLCIRKKVTFRNVCPLLDYIDHYRWSFFSSRYGKPSAPQCGPPIQGEDHCKYYQRHHHTLFLLQAYELLLVIGVIFYVRMNASVNISS